MHYGTISTLTTEMCRWLIRSKAHDEPFMQISQVYHKRHGQFFGWLSYKEKKQTLFI